jgi:hypothetical protein
MMHVRRSPSRAANTLTASEYISPLRSICTDTRASQVAPSASQLCLGMSLTLRCICDSTVFTSVMRWRLPGKTDDRPAHFNMVGLPSKRQTTTLIPDDASPPATNDQFAKCGHDEAGIEGSGGELNLPFGTHPYCCGNSTWSSFSWRAKAPHPNEPAQTCYRRAAAAEPTLASA